MRENYSKIEMLFDLPRRIRNIDNRIKSMSVCSWTEEDTEEVLNKIIKAQDIRNRLYDKYVAMAKCFNSLNGKVKTILTAVYLRDMSVKKVAEITQVAERTIYRYFDKTEELLEETITSKDVVSL